ncbi:MAG: disulfide bond formation protein B [Pseudomonadota bacterium]
MKFIGNDKETFKGLFVQTHSVFNDLQQAQVVIMFNQRYINFLGFFICHELLLVGYYFQFVEGMEPCPLCIFQRVAFMAVGTVFLIAALHNPQSALLQRMYNGAGIAAALSGLGIAWRHIYLQGLPADQVPSCGPGLEYMMNIFSFSEVIQKVMTGSGECAEVSWRFLGITMPGWALIWFIGFTIFFVYRFWDVKPNEKPA